MKLNGQYPTINEYLKAVLSAEKEDIKDKNVRNLMKILSIMPTMNSRLAGHIRTRKTGLRSWGWDIVTNEKSDLEKAKEVKYRLSKVINKITIEYIKSQLFGVSLIELKWDYVNNINVPNIYKIYKPYQLQKWENNIAIVDEYNNKKVIEYNSDYIQMLDDSDHVGGTLRTIAFTELLRSEIPKDWRNYNKKLKGIIQAIAKSDSAEDFQIAEDGVKNVTQDNYVVSNDFVDFQFHNMTAQGASQSFKDFNEALNSDIAIAILGNANTTELPSGSGSRAALQVQQMISADIMFDDVLNVTEIINEQLIKADFEKNYGVGVPSWEFIIPTNLETDYQSNAAALNDILINGIPVIKSQLYEKIGYKMPTPEDEVFLAENFKM